MAQLNVTLGQLGKGIKIPIGLPIVLQVIGSLPRLRLVGMGFDLNKSFLLPTAMPGIKAIKSKYDEHPNSNMLIVGHTDTSGQDAPNLTLSLERANSIAAFLTDNTPPWEAFFEASTPGDKRWGLREIQMMLSIIPDANAPFYKGAIDGAQGPMTTKAIKDFQSANNLKPDGVTGKDTRKALIVSYMNQDGTSLPKGIAAKAHGAGESFPEVETGDGIRNADNRRVEIFFFDGPITPPQPADRLSRKGSTEYPAWLKQVTETVDFTGQDRAADAGVIFMQLFTENGVTPLAGKSYVIKSDDGVTTLKGTLDSDGRLKHKGIPNDDYTLTITGVAETCSALVLLNTQDDPQIRFLA